MLLHILSINVNDKQNCTGSDLVNIVATIICFLFGQRHIKNFRELFAVWVI